MKPSAWVTLEQIKEARSRISAYIKRTPIIHSQTLSDLYHTNIFLKLEIFQKTGSFKVRGAFNKMLTLSKEERAHGVVAVSGGNHAQAVAHAARVLGMKALILMPESTAQSSVEATSNYGAQVVLTKSLAEAFERVGEYQKQGRILVHPFDDSLIVAGQGTIGLELLEDVPDLTHVLVSIGGGGLMSGVSVAIKTQVPEVRIWGVETEGADCMSRALAAGQVVTMPALTSIAKTLGAPSVSTHTLEIAQNYLEGVEVVKDAEAVWALETLLERVKVLTEPAASCTLAAVEHLRFKPDDRVVLILCGGNISVADICQYRKQFGSKP